MSTGSMPSISSTGRPRWKTPPCKQELRSVLASAIDDLSDDYRVAFLLRDVEGLSNAEIADVLDLGQAAVKSRIHRSRLLLRKRLAAYLS
jgi:RNA polymerase sigma-70 factor, ECF subfamily